MRGVGETGTDSVLLRSFSALDLSILAALELEAPALDAAGVPAARRTPRSPTCATSGTCAGSSRAWAGSTPRPTRPTCSSSWPAILASRPRTQQRLLDAIAAKLISPGTPVFTHAEDERLAAAVVSVARRSDFDPAVLDPWLERFVAAEKQVWTKAPPEPSLLDAAQNGRGFLRSLYVLLSLPAADADGHAGAGAHARTDARAREGAGDARRDPALAGLPRADALLPEPAG